MIIFQVIRDVFYGLGAFMQLPASSLYRYPYRNSGEAMKSDFSKIGKDLENFMNDSKNKG